LIIRKRHNTAAETGGNTGQKGYAMKTYTAELSSLKELQELIKQLESRGTWYYIHQETAPYIIEYRTA